MVHAELNAILNARGKNLVDSKIYVDLFPCHECAKAIIQAGITEVIYLYDKYAHTDPTIASKQMLRAAGITYRRVQFENSQILLNFDVNG